MNYASFYGGLPGAPFVIVKSFESIELMVSAFQGGASYIEVNYDEYVIIDTVNKNNPDNGKIYRRGYDFSSDMGGAIYIGQIVGPSGLAPILELNNYATVKSEIENMTEEEKENAHPTFGEMTIDSKDLIPGREHSGQYNDSIKWASYTIRDSDTSEDATAYIGFQIPYPYIDGTIMSVSPYKNGVYKDNAAIYRLESSHPFYQKFQFNIPKGVKGESFNDLKVVVANNATRFDNYEITEDDWGKAFLVYTYYNYDNKENGDPKEMCLGKYNMIENLQMSDDGTLKIQYTHNEDSVFPHKIKWIKSLSITADGNIITTFNTGEEEVQQGKFIFPKEVLFDTGISEGEGTQRIKVLYSNGEQKDISNPVNYIMKTAITSDYHLLLLHSDPKKRQSFVDSGANYTWEGRDDWQDMGSVKDEDGILIGLHFNSADYPSQLDTIENSINFLNTTFPNGLTGEDIQGKIVTVGNSEGNKSFFAFNYTITADGYAGWYYLGTFSNQLVVVGDDSEETRARAGNLITGGVWFVTEEV